MFLEQLLNGDNLVMNPNWLALYHPNEKSRALILDKVKRLGGEAATWSNVSDIARILESDMKLRQQFRGDVDGFLAADRKGT